MVTRLKGRPRIRARSPMQPPIEWPPSTTPCGASFSRNSITSSRYLFQEARPPFDGIVGIRSVNVGDYVKDGADRRTRPILFAYNGGPGSASAWLHMGILGPQRDGAAWDDSTTWTGSVVQDDAGLWHLFYTGATRAEDGLYQRIGHATSTDGHAWQRVNGGLCLDLHGLKDQPSVFQVLDIRAPFHGRMRSDR